MPRPPKKKLDTYDIRVMRGILSKLSEPLTIKKIGTGLESNHFTVYKTVKKLKDTGHISIGLSENDHGAPVMICDITEQGRQLLSALEAVEDRLK